MFNQGQVGTPRDAAAIAEMQNLLSTIGWQVGDQRRTTEKHGGFNGGRGIDFAVEMRDITAFWLATNPGGFTDSSPRNCRVQKPEDSDGNWSLGEYTGKEVEDM